MMRFIVYLILLAGLCGCSLQQFSAAQSQPQQVQFVAAMDQFIATGQTELLQQLQKKHSISVWGRYAATILQVSGRHENLNATLRAEQAASEQLRSQLTVLQQENSQLSEKIEQLKKLLISQEQRTQ